MYDIIYKTQAELNVYTFIPLRISTWFAIAHFLTFCIKWHEEGDATMMP